MYEALSSFVLGFHGCDKSVGLNIISGKDALKPSQNPWDWLGGGIYFGEQNPYHALIYANEVSDGSQFAKGKIREPFVLGVIIDLGHCLNLTSQNGVEILKAGYHGFSKALKESNNPMPQNKGFAARFLDRAVLEYIHNTGDNPSYDTVRGAFSEGETVYPGTTITEKNHIQICVRNPECIKGYFLPRPIQQFNPAL